MRCDVVPGRQLDVDVGTDAIACMERMQSPAMEMKMGGRKLAGEPIRRRCSLA